MLTNSKGLNVDLTAFKPFLIIIVYAGFIHHCSDAFSVFFIDLYFVSLFSLHLCKLHKSLFMRILVN